MWVGKQKWKQRERDREGKQVNANRKQELALINRKVSTDSKKCVTFHDFSLGTFEDSLYILAQNIRNNYIPYEEYKCHESLLYVATGSSVIAIDLRTMQIISQSCTRLRCCLQNP